MKLYIFTLALCAYVIVAATNTLLWAQAVTADIRGAITDSSGAVIQGAEITVKNLNKGWLRTTKSNSTGDYDVPQLTPADAYTVTVRMQGFKEAVYEGIILQTGQELRVDFALAPGGINESVTVASGASLLQTEEASTGALVDKKKVAELPLNGRQFWQLAQLIPNVAPPTQNSSLSTRGGLNISGHDEATNYYILDGINNVDATTMQPTVRPSVDGIQEFHVLTGIYNAEYGHYAGGQILVTTKSGTNEYHGTVFEFLRNSAMDARNFFNPGAVPAFRRNQFGASGGGKIKANKTFFFGTYEGLRSSQQTSGITSVPTAAMRTGNLSGLGSVKDPLTGAPFANNTIPASRLDKTSLALLQYWPVPNLPGVLNNYNFSLIGSENTNQFSARIDHTFSGRDTIFGSYQFSKRTTLWEDSSNCPTNTIPRFGCFEHEKVQSLAANYVHVFSSALINELRGGFNYMNTNRIQEDASFGNVGAELGIPQQSVPNPNWIGVLGVPSVSVTGYANIGSYNQLPNGRRAPTLNFVESLSWLRGDHAFKFGGDYLFFIFNYSDPTYYQARGTFTFNGQYTGNAFADFLLGNLRSASGFGGAPVHHTRVPALALFAQDEWKVTPRLTLSYGLRYELLFPSYELNNKIASFDPATGLVVVADGRLLNVNLTNGALVTVAGANLFGTRAWVLQKTNFAPRLGFAYRPFNNGKTALHAGIGIFYNQLTEGNGVSNLYRGIPFRLTQSFTNTPTQQLATWLNPYPAGTAVGGYTTTGINYHFKNAYVAQWSAGIQRELTPDLVMDISYLGSKGSDLPLTWNINQPPTPGTAPLQSRRPYSQWGTITWVDSVGNSSYHSLSGRLEKRFSNGLSALLSYTWSRSIDEGANPAGNGDGEAGIEDVTNISANRGNSSFDMRQRFVASVVYELPFGRGKAFDANASRLVNAIVSGWQTNGILSSQSGMPFTAVTSTDLSNTGANNRPFLVGNPQLSHRSVNEWFNTAAYRNSAPVPGIPAFGNAPRNDLVGPSLNNLDFGLSRNIKATERWNIQFRAEAFNVLNHPNFGLPIHDASSAGTFGKIVQTSTNSRDIQFGLKLVF